MRELPNIVKRYKFIIGGVIVFLLASLIIGCVIIEMHTIVEENSIRSEEVIIADKYYDTVDYHHHYYVTTDTNDTYTFADDYKDVYDTYNGLEVGKQYRFVLQDPDFVDENRYTHIIQVHNV